MTDPPPTTGHRRPGRVGRPQILARLIGGNADGWVIPVDEDLSLLFVTILDDRPRLLTALDEDARTVIDRSEGRWDFYEPIPHLPLDGTGHHGYRVTRALRPDDPYPHVAPPHIILDAIETMLSGADPSKAWPF